MFSFLLVGSLMFWAVVGIELLALFLFVCFENESGATASLVVFALLLWIGGGFDLRWFEFATVAKYAAIYFLVGLFWAIAKFYFKCKRTREYLLTKKAAGEKIDNWDIPSFDSYKAKIIGWASYWPLSMIAFILDDPIRRLITAMWNMFSGIFRQIYDNAFGDLKPVK